MELMHQYGGIQGLTCGQIAGASVATVFVVALIAVDMYEKFYRDKKAVQMSPNVHDNSSGRVPLNHRDFAEAPKFTVDKSVEFSYEELANATDNFSNAYKIGQGGFASVYYTELRGDKGAIRKMDIQATKEFFAELKVLTHVHHLNLVHLIGYCVEGSLFLVYEYVENGNLSQHLRGLSKETLSWHTRVQIALDSARGLEYDMFSCLQGNNKIPLESLASSAVRTTSKAIAKLIVVLTRGGTTAKLIAKYRPAVPILSVVVPVLTIDSFDWSISDETPARHSLVFRGLIPILAEGSAKATDSESTEVILEASLKSAIRKGLCKPGDAIVALHRIGAAYVIKIC